MIDLKRMHEITNECYRFAKETAQQGNELDWDTVIQRVDTIVNNHSKLERDLCKQLILAYIGYIEAGSKDGKN